MLGKNDNFDSGYTYASNWGNYMVCGSTLGSGTVIGGMFCMWNDYPGAETQTQEAKKLRLPLRTMGFSMDGNYSSSTDRSVAAGGFNADGTLNTDLLHRHTTMRYLQPGNHYCGGRWQQLSGSWRHLLRSQREVIHGLKISPT